MSTNRTPIRRAAPTVISRRALELFAELERARRARRRAVDCAVGPYGHCKTDECGACRRWWDAHAELHTELGLQPWQWPCLPRNPHPPGSAGARDWRPGTEPAELWKLMDEARRADVAPSSLEGGPYAEPEPVADQDTFT
jgi:hypothetical protein